jgi:ABC-type nitrate/sulfonate/bicarbonate transport system ATPase subunit
VAELLEAVELDQSPTSTCTRRSHAGMLQLSIARASAPPEWLIFLDETFRA